MPFVSSQTRFVLDSSGQYRGTISGLGGGRSVEPETIEAEQSLDEAFDLIVVPTAGPLDADWMPGEVDIL